MKQRLYIRAATAISPQQTFEASGFCKPVVSSDTGKLYALEAPYARYISPVAIRRMSRILKITISTAMQCLADAGVKTPDAIIMGTGRGAVADMEHFVKDMIRLDEVALNPTLFIQSTYNSPNGWIAMQSNCTGYNQTYVHRGCSFELAIQDAQMMAGETDEPLNMLVGCFDEMTEEYYHIRGKRGYWKQETVDSVKLFEHDETPGTIGGEGAAFFTLSTVPENAPVAAIDDLRIIYNADNNSVRAAVAELLRDNALAPEDISLVVTGQNGNCEQSHLYEGSLQLFDGVAPVEHFKHLCGEYDTATGFALWFATYLFNGKAHGRGAISGAIPISPLKHILIINHYIMGTASLLLLTGLEH